MSPRLSQIRIPVSLRRLFPQASFVGCADIRVDAATDDSRECAAGMLFAAIRGTQVDGSQFAEAAIQNGATSLLVEQPLAGANVPQCVVQNVRKSWAVLCAALAGFPSEKLQLVGVTGTNGKTTITWLLRSIFRAAHHQAGLLGTIEYDDGTHTTDSSLTTPDSRTLTDWLGSMVCRGTTHAAIELSSHALDQYRADGIQLNAGIVTNITQDHFDYHHTFEAYTSSKARIAELLKPGGRLFLNQDDQGCVALGKQLPSPTHISTFGLAARGANGVDVGGEILEESLTGTRFRWTLAGNSYDTTTRLIGRHNVSNCLAAIAAAVQLGISPHSIVTGLEQLTSVPGRLEPIDAGQNFTVLVDYAHTPDALHHVVKTVTRLTAGRVICVFGAGGDRDRSKRPLLGKAAEGADIAIITSDNPRTENPHEIIKQVAAGWSDPSRIPHQETDRKTAIESALRLAQPGDCVLIAGKGHEREQQIGKERHEFDDRIVTRQLLEELSDEPVIHRTPPQVLEQKTA